MAMITSARTNARVDIQLNSMDERKFQCSVLDVEEVLKDEVNDADSLDCYDPPKMTLSFLEEVREKIQDFVDEDAIGKRLPVFRKGSDATSGAHSALAIYKKSRDRKIFIDKESTK